MRVARLFAAPLLLLSACAAATSAAPPGTPQGAPAVATGTPLGRAIKAYEVTQDGEMVALPDAGIAEVDVNSVVRLHMDAPAIQSHLSGASGKGPQIQALETQATSALSTIEALKKSLTAIEQIRRAAPRTDAYKKAVEAQGDLAVAAYTEIRTFLKSRGLSTDVIAKLDDAELVPFLLEESKKIEGELAQQLKTMAGVRFRVQAQLTTKGKSTPIHLPNYDRLPDGDPKLIDKLVPVMTDDVKKQYELAGKMAAAAADLRGTIAETLKTLERDTTALLDSAVSLKVLARVAVSLKIPRNGKVKALKDALQKEQAEIQKLVDGCTKATAAWQSAKDRGDPLLFTSAAFTVITDCAMPILDKKQLTRLETLGKSIADVLGDAAAKVEIGVSLQADLEKLEILQRMQATLEPLVAAIGAITGGVPSSLPSSSAIALSEQTDRPYGQITDTVIDLTRTERQEKDFVTFQPAVTIDGRVVLDGAPVTMKVVRTGLHVNVSAGLFFVSPLDQATGEPMFTPAPAVTTAVHYRIARSSGEASPGGASALWNFMNAGIGFHAATLALGKKPEDGTATGANQIELGVGGALQLFGDLAQIGVGYDFQAERAYWFLGFGLQTATDFGISFPGTSAPKTSATP